MFPHLLAKSSATPDAPREPETLVGHLATVTRVAASLAHGWGERYLASLGLDSTPFLPALGLALPRAAFLHDLGKANDHFQRMLRAGRSAPTQACWHEQLSVWLMLRFDSLGSWFFAGCDAGLRQAILTAAVGHHLRLEDGSAIGLRKQSGSLEIVVLAGHPNFSEALESAAELLGLSAPPVLVNAAIDLVEPDAFDDVMCPWLNDASTWWRLAKPDERRFVAALKALLIASDVAGSAIPRAHSDPVAWTREVLDRVCLPTDLGRVVKAKLRGSSLRPFQSEVETSEARVTLVRAGCGSGKTAAAYLWAARNACGRKLFFCYPTTGTASQGFSDYVPPEIANASLVHSRATADLEDLLTNGTEEALDRLDWLTRFASLAAWDAPITICTVDTVLGLIQNNRKGLFSFPAIANGAFVFDEIHQYDDRLFGALLCFLEAFRGVPSLLMTASLQRSRLTAIQNVVAQLGERLAVVNGPAELEELKRYRLEQSVESRVWKRVEEVLGTGGRVLWVANTVKRAVRFAQTADQGGLSVLPYHSRYRYGDRLARHADVVQAFDAQKDAGVLAVTTQVCEISLDLSANLLVTDLAPIPALIQRLGRLNRRAIPGATLRAAPAIVVEPPAAEPYTVDELAESRQWLDVLGEGAVSQADLAATFELLAEAAPAIETYTHSNWLDGGVLASPAPVREAGTTFPVVREEDTVRLRSLSKGRRNREIIRLTIPMPIGPVAREIGSWRREGAALVAPAGRLPYNERFGGRWS